MLTKGSCHGGRFSSVLGARRRVDDDTIGRRTVVSAWVRQGLRDTIDRAVGSASPTRTACRVAGSSGDSGHRADRRPPVSPRSARGRRWVRGGAMSDDRDHVRRADGAAIPRIWGAARCWPRTRSPNTAAATGCALCSIPNRDRGRVRRITRSREYGRAEDSSPVTAPMSSTWGSCPGGTRRAARPAPAG